MKQRMMARKTTPKVVRGRVQKKNRTVQTAGAPRTLPRIVRKPPIAGRSHVVTRSDVRRFLTLLPEWQDLICSVEAVVLDEGRWDCDACYFYDQRTIRMQPWSDMVQRWAVDGVDDHYGILSRLNVPMRDTGDGVVCCFTRETARAYMLLHVFMHELGHHRHWTRWGIHGGRSEKLAEELALRFEGLLWDRYTQTFGIPDPGADDAELLLQRGDPRRGL